MIYDLHVHSIYSDGTMNVKEIFDKAQELGINVVITDHNEIKGSVELYEKSDFNLCGIEIGCRDGKEILLYFSDSNKLEEYYKKEVEPFKSYRMTRINRDIEDILLAEPLYCFSVYPHPLGPYKKNINYNFSKSLKILKFVDGIEIFNSLQSLYVNKKAEKQFRNTDKFFISSSDAHVLQDIGKGLTDIEFDNCGLLSATIIKKQPANIKSKISTINNIITSNIIHTRKNFLNV